MRDQLPKKSPIELKDNSSVYDERLSDVHREANVTKNKKKRMEACHCHRCPHGQRLTVSGL